MFSKKLFSLLVTLILFATSSISQELEGFEVDQPNEEEPLMTLSEKIAAEGHPLGRYQLEVTHENMNEILHGDWVILLYTPWTMGSIPVLTYLPYLDGATASVAPSLRYAAVDCSLYPEVHTFYPHKGYPTLILARNGVVLDKHGEAYDSEGLFGFASRVARKVSSEPAPVPELVGNRAVDEKIVAVKNAVMECFYKYTILVKEGMDKIYVAAVGLEISPVLFAGICGAGAVIVLLVVLMVLSLCQSDLDVFEAEKKKMQDKSAEKKKNDGPKNKEEGKAKGKEKSVPKKAADLKKKSNNKRKQD